MSQQKKGRPTPSRRQRADEAAARSQTQREWLEDRHDLAGRRAAVARMARTPETPAEPEYEHQHRWPSRKNRRAAARKGKVIAPRLNKTYTKPQVDQ